MSESPSMHPMVNKSMKFILRSPLHPFISKYILLITFTGRKSGNSYTTPVSYSLHDGQVFIFTHANWWKNLCDGAPVNLRIRGREHRGIANPVAEDKQAVANGLTAHLKKAPFDARFYDVTMDDEGNPNIEDVAQAVKSVVMIRVQLDA